MNKIKILLTTTMLLLAITRFSAAGEIALSFDDAPRGGGGHLSGMERTQMLIGKLDSLDIKQVVFYCVSNRFDQDSGKARLQMYSEAGHLIANHTHNHPDLDKVGAKRFGTNITRTHNELGAFSTQVNWFRYPMLHEGKTRPVRDSVREFLKQQEYFSGYVTVDNYDFYIEKAFQTALKEGRVVDFAKLKKAYVDILWSGILFYDSIAVRTLGRSPKHVLLLHENDVAALFIDALVARIRAEGWTIISPTEAYTDPIADELPDVLLNGQGRVAAIAKSLGYEGSFWHESEDTDWLDACLEKAGVFE
jgi:peptidoglycan/xylan/chitin deacetylase (PgdA/CDA1 family)